MHLATDARTDLICLAYRQSSYYTQILAELLCRFMYSQREKVLAKEPFLVYTLEEIGLWRSLVARLNGVQEAPSSNLGSPTR